MIKKYLLGLTTLFVSLSLVGPLWGLPKRDSDPVETYRDAEDTEEVVEMEESCGDICAVRDCRAERADREKACKQYPTGEERWLCFTYGKLLSDECVKHNILCSDSKARCSLIQKLRRP